MSLRSGHSGDTGPRALSGSKYSSVCADLCSITHLGQTIVLEWLEEKDGPLF